MTRSAWVYFALGCSALTLGCGEAGEFTEGTATSEGQHLYQSPGSTLWSGGVVPVCWTPSSTTFADFGTFSTRVRRVVTDNWGRAANLNFVGWDNTCGSNPTGIIAIQMDNVGGNSDAGGFGSTTGLRTLRFGLDRNNDGVILHEFGHELGFRHEFDRPDFSDHDGCTGGNTPGGNAWGTPPDDVSIMNETYCQSNGRISRWDIVGVQNAYGRRKQGVLLGMNGQCVNIPNGGNPPVGLDLQVYECSSAPNEIWSYTNQKKFRAKNVTSIVWAMDIEGGSAATNIPVQMYTANPASATNQQWNFNAVRIIGVGGMCLDRPAGQNRIQILGCNGAASQNWDILPQATAGQIRIRATGTSSCIQTSSGTVGTDLSLATCTTGSSAAQVMTFTAAGEIRNRGLCFDSEWGDPLDGRTMQIYSCKAAGIDKSNQQYFLRGKVVSGLNTCLTTPTVDFRTHDPLRSWACPGFDSADFVWDYYMLP